MVMLTTVVVYLPALRNGFTNWDDADYVLENSIIKAASWASIRKIFTEPYFANYHPLTTLTYWIEFYFFRLTPFYFHLTSLLLHTANSVLVAVFCFRLSGNRGVALLSGLLFGVHPLHVESAAWVAERKDVLYTAFYLGALLVYLDYLQSGRRRYLAWCGILFLCSLLSKAMAVTLPVVLILLDHLQRRRWDWRAFAEKVPFFALTAAFIVIAVVAQKQNNALRDEALFTLWVRLTVACHGLLFYLNKFLLPLCLSAIYPYGTLENHILLDVGIGSPWHAPYYLAVVVVLYAVLAYRYRSVLFGGLFLLVTISPVLQFVPIGASVAADRYMYAPSLGVIYLVALGFRALRQSVPERAPGIRLVLAAAAALIVAGFSYLSYERCHVWKDGVTLWDDTIAKYPRSQGAHCNRGTDLFNQRDYKEAVKAFDVAIAIAPNYLEAYNNRGNTYSKLNELDKALQDYNSATALKPTYAAPYNNRGILYFNFGLNKEALEEVCKALEYAPTYGDAYFNRGMIHTALGDVDAALADFNGALELDPFIPEAYKGRGSLYLNRQRYPEALQDLNRAIAMKPGYWEAHNLRGNLFKDLGRNAEAVREYTVSLSLKESVDGYNNRGIAYENLGEREKALEDYAVALKLEPNQAETFLNRGFTYSRMGESEKALADYARAAELKPEVPIIYKNRGVVYNGLKDYGKAIADFTRALDLDPGYAEARINRAVNYYLAKDYDGAWKDVSELRRQGQKVGDEFLEKLRHESGIDVAE